MLLAHGAWKIFEALPKAGALASIAMDDDSIWGGRRRRTSKGVCEHRQSGAAGTVRWPRADDAARPEVA